jgi:surface antigen
MLRTQRTILCLMIAGPLLPACTIMDGGALESAVDRSIVTGSIAAPASNPAPAPDPEQLSDRRTVRNAISAADVGASQPLAWRNADTGASGTITSIVEARRGDSICRSFTTSRQRFDGVALYAGEACTAGEGEWVLTKFSEGG